jgi:actin-related protein
MAIEHLFLHFVMNELREDPNACPVLVSENAGCWSDDQRKFVANLLLHKIGFAGVGFIPAQAMLAISAGAANSLVVDLGESGVRVALVLGGKIKPSHAVHSKKGGRAIKQYIAEKIAPAKLKAGSLDAAMKQLLAFPTSSAVSSSDVDAAVVDGVSISAEVRVRALEDVLFAPNDPEGVPALLKKLLGTMSAEEKALTLENMVIGGGLASIKGVSQRVKNEVAAITGSTVSSLKVNALQGAFSGMTVLASMEFAVATAKTLDKRKSALVGYPPGLFED